MIENYCDCTKGISSAAWLTLVGPLWVVCLLIGSESWIDRCSRSNLASSHSFQVKCEAKLPLSKAKNNNSNCKKGSNEDKSKVSVGEECQADEQAFLVALYKYMKERKTPIERIPYLGFKQSK